METSRYKETFHITRYLFGMTAAHDGVTVVLNSDIIFCDETNVLQGVIGLTVAKPMKTNGIYIHLLGREQAYQKLEKQEEDKTYELINMHVPVVGTETFKNRSQQTILYNKGTYRIPFSIQVPPQGNQGEKLPASYSRTRGSDYAKVSYTLQVIVVRPSWINLSSTQHVLHMVPQFTAEMQELLQEQEPVSVSAQKSVELLGSEKIRIQATIPGAIILLDQQVLVHLEINNTSRSKVTHLLVSVKEHVNMVGSAVLIAWDNQLGTIIFLRTY
eukprot:TRINITY_DN7831_c0_g1_i7.p1 TRINITY_DN7831_c0_g1~~TRINITY_DN7831_c0_g1_i7.p1  ORF type:complete len:272 (+),score=33.37 TRINITY_DN7831_c0_g1_i7:481-1296(+)